MMVDVHEAKTNFSKLLEMARTGQEIILPKCGKPYALLTPLPSGGVAQRKSGRLAAWQGYGFFVSVQTGTPIHGRVSLVVFPGPLDMQQARGMMVGISRQWGKAGLPDLCTEA